MFAFKENVFDVYTEVAAFMGWINQTILSMGGMQACGLTLEATPTEGWLFLQLDGDTGDEITLIDMMIILMVFMMMIVSHNL